MDPIKQHILAVLEYLDAMDKLDFLDGYVADPECYSLMTLAAYGPAEGEIVEIGSMYGKSTCWMALGSMRTDRERITAVDHFTGSPEHQPGAEHELPEISRQGTTFHHFMANVKKAGVYGHVAPIPKPSCEAVKEWTKPIRLLFIDGDHSYEVSKQDFELWSPYVVPDGLIAFHDIDGWEGVTAFYNELINTNSDYNEVLEIQSLRVIQKR